MIRLLLALSGGVTAGSLTLLVLTGYPEFEWIFPAGLTVFILLGILISVGRSLRGVILPPNVSIGGLLRDGLGAPARIESARRTGTEINGSLVCEFTLVVVTEDRAYTTRARELIDPLDIPRYQPGTVVAVARLDADRPEVRIVKNPDSAWRDRIAAADAVPPRSEAPVWEIDDAPRGFESIVGTDRVGRPPRLIAYAATFVVGVALLLVVPGVFDKVNAQYLHGDASYDDFVDGDRRQVVVDALLDEAGGTEVIGLVLYDDGRATLEAPAEPDSLQIDDFVYRHGRSEHEGPSLIQPEDPAMLLFDMDEIDLDVIDSLVAQARTLTGIADPESSRIQIFRQSADINTGERRGVVIEVSVDRLPYDGTIRFTPGGEVLLMSGGTPGSPADRGTE